MSNIFQYFSYFSCFSFFGFVIFVHACWMISLHDLHGNTINTTPNDLIHQCYIAINEAETELWTCWGQSCAWLWWCKSSWSGLCNRISNGTVRPSSSIWHQSKGHSQGLCRGDCSSISSSCFEFNRSDNSDISDYMFHLYHTCLECFDMCETMLQMLQWDHMGSMCVCSENTVNTVIYDHMSYLIYMSYDVICVKIVKCVKCVKHV